MAPSPAGQSAVRRTGRPLAVGLSALLLGLAACAAPGLPAPPVSSASTPGGPTAGAPTAGTSSTGGTPSVSADPEPDPSAGSPVASPAGPRDDTCRQLVGELNLGEQVGQLVMVAVGSTGMSRTERQALVESHAGSALLLGNSTAGTEPTAEVVRQVRAAADRPAKVEVLVAADQEGGLVQRLSGPGFTDIPSAVRQAGLSDAELTSAAQQWGVQLDRAGVNADLAPVADVVPRALAGVNEPVGKLRRGYGSSPATVAAKVSAFTTGMDQAGLATAVKHFPGLGEVRGNTDVEQRVVDRTTTRDGRSLRGFAAAVDAGVDMVMVSSAVYTRIDAERPAVFSPTVVEGMIRRDLGFEGVVISDDLSAAAVSGYSAERRALGFVDAGGDLMIVADPASAVTMARALLERGSRDRSFAQRIEQSARRVLVLKDRRGLARC